jgi:hypothetical protein
MNTLEWYLAEHDDWIKARKKPIIVLAMRLDDDIIIETLEGDMVGRKGDYLIRGTAGEYYPIKPKIFHETYDDMGSLR